jgi:hypothetical protein
LNQHCKEHTERMWQRTLNENNPNSNCIAIV